MQPYDIVSKLWIQQCTEAFLKELVRARIKQFEPVEELAQEQPAISRADYVLRAKTPAGTSQVFVLRGLITRFAPQQPATGEELGAKSRRMGPVPSTLYLCKSVSSVGTRIAGFRFRDRSKLIRTNPGAMPVQCRCNADHRSGLHRDWTGIAPGLARITPEPGRNPIRAAAAHRQEIVSVAPRRPTQRSPEWPHGARRRYGP